MIAGMSTVAIIPARGGSRGVPGKNLRPIGGVPLIARAVRACRAARRIDDIYVTTDDQGIADAAQSEGAHVIRRPAELAGDTASSESALLHALNEIADLGVDAKTLVFVQCTSPFIDPHDLDAGIALVAEGAADSVFSGVETYAFLWRDASDATAPGSGPMVGQNHDAAVRPRRQDRRPDYRETGAFYVMDIDGFRRAGHRFFGTTRVVPVSELASLEIDTAEELALADAFAGVLDRPSVDLPLDVDVVFSALSGVFTDGSTVWNSDGSAGLRLADDDLRAVTELGDAGVRWVFLPSGLDLPVPALAGSEVLAHRTKDAIDAWLREHGVAGDRAALITADPADVALYDAVGWPVSVAEAPQDVQATARVTLTHRGGEHAVRDVVARVLAARGA